MKQALYKKWSFQWRISSVNVTKSTVSCGFRHIYWRNPQWKTSFFVQWERINKEFKYEDLDWCSNSHISELFTIIVKSLPRRYERHVKMKVFYSSGFEKYQLEIPSYLWNRPKAILDDILKKMGMVSPEMIASIKPVPNAPDATYLVEQDSIHGKEIHLPLPMVLKESFTLQAFLCSDQKWIWSFRRLYITLRISSGNVTKSAGNCGFGYNYWRNP